MNYPKNRGFTLTELTIVMVIVSLMFVFMLPLAGAFMENERRTSTAKKMDNIQLAMVNYAMANKRLPCPAIAVSIEDVGAGVEARDAVTGVCANNQGNGVVPWKTIGMAAAEVLDAWYNQITYRVAYSLTLSGSPLDMSLCDPAGTKVATIPPVGSAASTGLCSPSCTGNFSASNCTSPANFILQKGLNVSDGASTVMDYMTGTGAAYALISHGQNGYGAFNQAGFYQAIPAKNIAGTTLENPNLNLATLAVDSNAPPVLVDAPYRDAGDATVYFDDIVVRPSILTLISKAQLGPRSH